jgi:hypothetical protein
VAAAALMTEELVRDHRFGLPLERELPYRFVRKRVGGQYVGRLADVGLARGSCRLQSLSEYHRLAEDRVVHSNVAAEDACHHSPGVDTDV